MLPFEEKVTVEIRKPELNGTVSSQTLQLLKEYFFSYNNKKRTAVGILMTLT